MKTLLRMLFGIQYDIAVSPKVYTQISPRYAFGVLILLTITACFALSFIVISPILGLNLAGSLWVTLFLVVMNGEIIVLVYLMFEKLLSWISIGTEDLQLQKVAFFSKHDLVRHIASGNEYIILEEPDSRLLESTGEPFYEYQDVNTNKVWIRSKFEMEDGRFCLIIQHQSV